MPELSSDLGDAAQFQLIPNSIQNAHVVKCDDTDPNNPNEIKKTKSGLGYQVTMDWEIDEGPYAGKQVRFDNLAVGGSYRDDKTGETKPLSLAKLCDFLSNTQVPWQCLNCNSDKRPHRFYIGTGDDGLTKGKYYCPDCKAEKMRINYNTSDFLGARCAIRIGSQKQQGKDDEYNVVKGYAPVRTY